MKNTPSYLENKICLNVLANSVENAVECYKISEGHIVLGLLSKKYESVELAVEDMKRYKKAVNNAISIGLGAGDPNQSQMVSDISQKIQPQHVNQVFTGVGATRALLGQNDTVINGLVSPTGTVGMVNIATGPLSSKQDPIEVPIETAIEMLKDMGCNSVKYFPMEGLKHIEEYKYVAKVCAKQNFYLEPTGGIDLENFEEIVTIAVEAGVEKIIPHIYSSIIDSETGNTRPEDVQQLLNTCKKVLNK